MDRPSADDRSAISQAWSWGTRIIGIAIELVVPPLLGYYLLDRWLGTGFIFLLIGFAIGLGLFVWQLMGVAKQSASESSSTTLGKHRRERDL